MSCWYCQTRLGPLDALGGPGWLGGDTLKTVGTNKGLKYGCAAFTAVIDVVRDVAVTVAIPLTVVSVLAASFVDTVKVTEAELPGFGFGS